MDGEFEIDAFQTVILDNLAYITEGFEPIENTILSEF
jgi:hypothetical protein